MTQMTRLALSAIVSLTLLSQAAPAADPTARPADFGKRWVRSHPYTLMGLCINREQRDIGLYTKAGFNHMLAWRPWREGIMKPTVAAKLTWFGNLAWVGQTVEIREKNKRDYKKLVNELTAQYPGNVGWLVNDEPRVEELQMTGEAIEWIKRKCPDKLVFSNVGNERKLRPVRSRLHARGQARRDDVRLLPVLHQVVRLG